MNHTPITPDMLITEAARLIMAEQLAIVYEHLPALRQSADAVAVHESRKAIRRTFTLFKLFTPIFAPHELEPHRQTLRRLMRRLAPCRDTARLGPWPAGPHTTAEQHRGAVENNGVPHTFARSYNRRIPTHTVTYAHFRVRCCR